MTETAHQNTKADDQKANAFLRERFLYLISTMPDTACKIKMCENTEVSGQIKAFDIPFQNIVVEKLKTPHPSTLKKALIRTCDVISITYDDMTLE